MSRTLLRPDVAAVRWQRLGGYIRKFSTAFTVDLPDEIVLLIISHVTAVSDLLRMRLVCKTWNQEMLSMPTLWRTSSLYMSSVYSILGVHLPPFFKVIAEIGTVRVASYTKQRDLRAFILREYAVEEREPTTLRLLHRLEAIIHSYWPTPFPDYSEVPVLLENKTTNTPSKCCTLFPKHYVVFPKHCHWVILDGANGDLGYRPGEDRPPFKWMVLMNWNPANSLDFRSEKTYLQLRTGWTPFTMDSTVISLSMKLAPPHRSKPLVISSEFPDLQTLELDFPVLQSDLAGLTSLTGLSYSQFETPSPALASLLQRLRWLTTRFWKTTGLHEWMFPHLTNLTYLSVTIYDLTHLPLLARHCRCIKQLVLDVEISIQSEQEMYFEELLEALPLRVLKLRVLPGCPLDFPTLLSKHCPSLESLEERNWGLTNGSLMALLSGCPQLMDLTLYFNTDVTPRAFSVRSVPLHRLCCVGRTKLCVNTSVMRCIATKFVFVSQGTAKDSEFGAFVRERLFPKNGEDTFLDGY